MQEKIARLEQAADHLIYAEMSGPEKQLRLWVTRLRNAPHRDETIVAPFDRQTLSALKEMADASRVTQIAAIRQI